MMAYQMSAHLNGLQHGHLHCNQMEIYLSVKQR